MKGATTLFTLTILLGAYLLFSIQPMVGKLVLPLLGGSPSVWNTVMLFFQALLLAGYGYAHGVGKLGLRAQIVIHAAVMLGAAALLPIALPKGEGWALDPEGFQPGQVLMLLAVAAAGPAFIMCSASPLLQKWYALSGLPRSSDPYFLYIASNIGSMAALLGYPLLIEPRLTLGAQRTAWSVGFGVFALLALACGVVARRHSRRERVQTAAAPMRAPDMTEAALTRRRVMWVLLSFVPAGLMMGATQHITTDIAAVPLLWVLPLAIYLLTFIIAFTARGPMIGRVCGWLMPPVVVGVAMMAITHFPAPAWAPIGLHYTLLFTGAMTCHGRLAALRPPPERLTEYYLLTSVGGVLAGILCGITAPSIFDGIVEYPLFIAGACLLREGRPARTRVRAEFDWARLTLETVLWILVIGIVPCYVFCMAWMLGPHSPRDAGTRTLLFNLCWIIPAGLTLVLLSRRWLYAAAVLMLLSIPWFDRQVLGNEVLQVRTFFGVHRVVLQYDPRPERTPYHLLMHGGVEHGRQARTSPRDREPLAYFTRSGPVGDVFAELDRRLPDGAQKVAIIGLGAGTLAAYGDAGRAITFYEIDPVVKAIANEPEFFTYTRDSASPIDYVLGDARLTVARAADASYDLIAMDAFSSDAVPVHLITREALALYERTLAPGGLIMVNVSNRYLDFEPVLSALARDAGMVGVIRKERHVPLTEMMAGKQPSAFIILARREADLGLLRETPNWRALKDPGRVRAWTDDYSDVLGVMKWGGQEE